MIKQGIKGLLYTSVALAVSPAAIAQNGDDGMPGAEFAGHGDGILGQELPQAIPDLVDDDHPPYTDALVDALAPPVEQRELAARLGEAGFQPGALCFRGSAFGSGAGGPRLRQFYDVRFLRHSPPQSSALVLS